MSSRKELQQKFAVLKRKYLIEHPNCEVCLLLGKITPSVDVHHIVGRWHTDYYLNEENFVALCRFHHIDVHQNPNGKTKALIKKIRERKNG